jgi:hypothetical protein
MWKIQLLWEIEKCAPSKIPMLESVTVTLFIKSVFADVIKLRILSLGNDHNYLGRPSMPSQEPLYKIHRRQIGRGEDKRS